MSVKVFRFHEGADVYGWDNSNPLNDKAIAAIKDPNGEHASKEITSIPSPFARIDLVNTAFKEVANRSLDGDTIYHKMVSDALDIGQILFDFEKYQDKIEIISWDPVSDLSNLLNSSSSGQKALGESLRLYLQQDSKAYNFDKMHKMYLLNYKLGNNPLNIIGGTSPASLFFTSANKFTLKEFTSAGDTFFDDDYCALQNRDSSYIEYLFLLSKVIPNFAVDFKNFSDYLEKVFPLLTNELRTKILNQNSAMYNELVDLSIDGRGEVVEVLKVNLKRSKGNLGEISKSDFIINSPKNLEKSKPLLALPNDIITGDFHFVSANWDNANKAPSYLRESIDERKLPFDGSKYPYLVASDFLEPVLLKTHLPIDNYYFKNGQDNNEHGFLLPLKPLFFEYFGLDFLDKIINGEKMFEVKFLANNHIDIYLRIPVQKNKHITYKRTYYNPISYAHKPDYSEESNKGAILENKINLGITPFYKFGNGIDPEYNVAFYDADSLPLFQGNKYHIHFYKSYNQQISLVQQTQRRFKEEENIDMFGLVVNSNFDYLQIKHDYGSGILIPNFESKVRGGLDQFTVAIDFGTTNTHIEFSRNKGISEPFELLNSESKHIGHLINDNDFDESFLKFCKVDLVPNIIQKGSVYEFPQRTVIAYHKLANFTQPMFSMSNIAIPFQYEKKSFAVNTEIETNLKWNKNANSSMVMRSFFEQLIKMIRDKILLNNGDLKQTKIVWSYPASMMIFELNELESKWNDIILKYLGSEIKISKVCESLTPFYYYINEKGKAALEKPMVSIDIGGGTSDIAIYEGEKPILFSSYKFAGDAIFGDNYNRNININGFVKRFKAKLYDELKNNNLADLGTVMNNIISKNKSNDAINVLFSLENNPLVKEKSLPISFLESLKADRDLKIIFLLFYVAHIYHLAHIFESRKLNIPVSISFSGTASKLLTILDTSKKKKTLKIISEFVFSDVFNTSENVSIDVLLEDNPKEIASKGAIYFNNSHDVNIKEIKEVLINHNTLMSESEKFNYNDIQSLEADSLKDYEDFLRLFFRLNEHVSFKEYFGIDNSTLKFTNQFLKDKRVNAMKMGINNKITELENHNEEEIAETLFFYPLVGSLGELAYNLVTKNET